MKELTRKEIFVLTIRTFFIKLYYNYKNLFGIGLCYCLLPIGRSSCFKTKEDKSRFNKNFSFFNTNEYLSGYAVGIALKMEYSGQQDRLIQIKETLSGTLGAIGDNLVNEIIHPLMVFAALNIFFLNDFKFNKLTILPIIALILLFNIFNFFIRYYGIKEGYKSGFKSLKFFKSETYKRIIKYLQIFRDILAFVLAINIILMIDLPIINYAEIFNLFFTVLLIFYIIKYLPVFYREVSMIVLIIFYISFYQF